MHPTCEHCHKNVATVHLTEIVEKVPRETHLCEQCAQKLSVGSTAPPQQLGSPDVPGASESTGPVISSILEPVMERMSENLRQMKCPKCGMTWQEFRAKGRLGCAHDYSAFEEGLFPLIEKIQGVSPPEHPRENPGTGPGRGTEGSPSPGLSGTDVDPLAMGDESPEPGSLLDAATSAGIFSEAGDLHSGEIPEEEIGSPEPSQGDLLAELERDLARAVEKEDYERAATLRDQIRSLTDPGADSPEQDKPDEPA